MHGPLKKAKTPITDRRGLHSSMILPDALCATLVRAGVEETAGALARELKTKQWQKSVPRPKLPPCDLYEPRFYPFQYRGHAWTTIVHRFGFDDLAAKRISVALGTSVIWLCHEDTSSSWAYILFTAGKLREAFGVSDAQEFYTPTPAEFAQLEERGVFAYSPHPYYCISKVRTLDAVDFEALIKSKGKKFGAHLDHLFDGFLRSQDAFLAFNLWEDVGREYFPLFDVADPDIVRIDVVEKESA
jgi:hypothetical protein